jgi:hypothetical protein
MPDFYTYIIASLPALTFPALPPINRQKFLDACRDLVGTEEFSLLKAISKPGLLRPFGARNDGYWPASTAPYPVLARVLDFETALRNELVGLRAGRKRKDPQKYIRENIYWSPEAIHAAMAAYKDISILDAEKILDLERWRYLDELCAGHFFDFEFLIVYALKLKILERWEKIRRADKVKLLEEALA